MMSQLNVMTQCDVTLFELLTWKRDGFIHLSDVECLNAPNLRRCLCFSGVKYLLRSV